MTTETARDLLIALALLVAFALIIDAHGPPPAVPQSEGYMTENDHGQAGAIWPPSNVKELPRR